MNRHIVSLSGSVISGLMVLTMVNPTAMADTTSGPMLQDLTSLGTITTADSGQPDATFTKYEQNYPGPITSTTGWTGFCRQGGRYITIQFPKWEDVEHIKITMKQSPSAGVYYPKDVQFEAFSTMDDKWYLLGTNQTNIPQTDAGNTTQVFQFDSQKGIQTNAVRIYFPVGVWVFANSLDITGSTTGFGEIPNSSMFPAVSNNQSAIGALTPYASAYGIHNMLLVETGGHGNLGTWSASDFKPMIEYINPMGYEITPLFDTMLFVPYPNVPDTKTGWTNYLNDLFAPNRQLDALNQAIATANQAVNRPGYKEKVVLNIPYFPYGNNDFGTVNGQEVNFNGSTDDLNAIIARTTALNWYMNTLLGKWKAANYQNLQLVGLYWNEEQYQASAPGEKELLQAAENSAHSNNLPLLWIPFYDAAGSTKWQSLGFNAAWLQSNFIEGDSITDVNRISSAANIAKENGMGIEVELTGLDSQTQQLYQTFLQNLDTDEFGGTNVSHAFYDGSKLLLNAQQSTEPAVHALYDETASFILTGTN